MRICNICVSLWLCFTATTVLGHGDMNFKGSEGGIVRSIAAAPSASHVVYAATSQAGIFKSSDNGNHWIPVNRGLTRVDVLALVLDPNSPAKLYAGTRSGLFKTMDGGSTWQPTGPELDKEQVKSLTLDPNDGKTLYAGTYHGLWTSTNEGATWSRLAKQPDNTNISALAITRDTEHSLYAGTPDGLFRSRDGGTTWTRSSQGLTVPSIATLVPDPTRPQTVYAGTGDGAYRSDDGGDKWHSITFGQTNLPVTAILVDPHHPDTVYLGTSFVGGLFKTEDGGKSWIRIRGDNFTPAITALAFSPDDPKALIAGTAYFSKVFTSPDAGLTWETTPDKLLLPSLESVTGTPDGASLYAGAHDGFYRFNISQQTWERMKDPNVGPLAKVAYLKGKSPAIWVCGAKGVAEGRLKKDFIQFHRPLSAPKDCTELVLNEQNGHILAAAKNGLWIGPGRWQHRAIPAQGEPIHQLAVSKNGKTVYALTEHRLLQSADEGKTWTSIEKDGSFVFTAVAETGKKPTALWIATSSDISYRKPDGNWVNTSQGVFPPGVTAITATPNDGSVYAASQILGRVFSRQPNEEIWSSSDLEEGAPDISDLWADPAHEGVLYAATRNSGLFRSDDRGMHWLSVNAGLK